MSYIQIEIGGKLRGLKFNQMAVVVMSQKADLENYEATATYAMVYAGLKACCYVKSIEADFTFEQVCDWVDEIDPNKVLDIYNTFAETQAYKSLVDKGKADEEPITKKKLKKAV